MNEHLRAGRGSAGVTQQHVDAAEKGSWASGEGRPSSREKSNGGGEGQRLHSQAVCLTRRALSCCKKRKNGCGGHRRRNLGGVSWKKSKKLDLILTTDEVVLWVRISEEGGRMSADEGNQ